MQGGDGQPGDGDQERPVRNPHRQGPPGGRHRGRDVLGGPRERR